MFTMKFTNNVGQTELIPMTQSGGPDVTECDNEAEEQRKGGEREKRQKDANGNEQRNTTAVPTDTPKAVSTTYSGQIAVGCEIMDQKQRNESERDNRPAGQDANGNEQRSVDNFPSVRHNRNQSYVAFLLCPSDDLVSFGKSFLRMLEGWGLKIFCPERDLLAGGIYFEVVIEAIERCNGKIIVILSKNYPRSEECRFLTHHARSLDPDSRRRNIIPVVIDNDVELISVLQGVAIIKYNQAFRCGWLKQRLCEAIAA